MVAPVGLGKTLETMDSIQRREVKEWRDRIGDLHTYLQSLVDQGGPGVERAKLNEKLVQALYDEADESTRSWTKTREEIEARKSYMDLQAKIIDAWPRSAVADRLFYLGTGLLGGGGLAYAFYGPQQLTDAFLLWLAGALSLLFSMFSLQTYDRERASHFRKIRDLIG
jgi:hypothetical protein